MARTLLAGGRDARRHGALPRHDGARLEGPSLSGKLGLVASLGTQPVFRAPLRRLSDWPEPERHSSRKFCPSARQRLAIHQSPTVSPAVLLRHQETMRRPFHAVRESIERSCS